MSLLLASRRLRATAASLLLGAATSTFALDTATIVSSALSPDCLEYRVAGICYWLYCTPFGCSVRTSVKVRHYVPDAVVSSYSNTGENPWLEVRAMSMPNPTAKAGGDGTTNHDNENNLAKFKNADVIGHPAGTVFSQFASASGYTCEGAGTAFMPYLLSTLDT
ncbi:TPA: TIGR03756 family integrating conjugative element protein, partial [Pseudomonas aeruginosa]